MSPRHLVRHLSYWARQVIGRHKPIVIGVTGTECVVSRRHLVCHLSYWARQVIRRHKPIIIGVTGTVGKTTLTSLMKHVLQQPRARRKIGKVRGTIGNQNGDRGLPCSVLQLKMSNLKRNPAEAIARVRERGAHLLASDQYPRVLVLEYAAYDNGHLHWLTRLVPPDIAIVTTIGPGHMQRLGTVEGVYEEKRALVLAAPEDGLVVLGGGHDFVERLTDDARAPVEVVDGKGLALAANITRVVCRHLGLPVEVAEAGIASFQPPAGRLNQFTAHGMTIIDDTFNANPLSIKLGLDVLKDASEPGRRVAVLGGMAELGDQSADYHREIGLYAKERGITVIGVGEAARDYAPDHWYEDSAVAAARVKEHLQHGDIVLIKGSHSAHMKVVADALRTAG